MLIAPPIKSIDYGVSIIDNIEPDICDELISLYKDSEIQKSRINKDSDQIEDDIRQCVVFLPENEKVLKIIANAGMIANGKYFNFDISGIIEKPQLLKYGQDDNYDWHIDIGNGFASTRKISISIILNDEFEGGELSFFTNKEYRMTNLSKGDVIAFPSFFAHKVYPVTSGTRWSLVGWIGGNPFR